MRMLFLAALLEISLSCLAQAIRTLPPTGAEPSLLFTTPAAAQALAFFAPKFELQYGNPSSGARTSPACDPIVHRPLLSNSFDKAFVLAPPSTHPAQTQPPSDQGCPAPKIQFLATTTRPHAITWPQTQFKNIPGESP
jgi:hypothetical protein